MYQNNVNWKQNTIFFLLSQAVTLLGSSLVQYAIVWYLTLSTGSGTVMMGAVIAGFLPTFIISPFSGVLADRFNKKTLIIVADLFIASTTLILAILLFNGYESTWLFYLALSLRALGAGIQAPAVGSLIPAFVPENLLTRVNGINGTIQTIVMIISPMISAALLSVFDLGHIFLIDVVTAVLASAILYFLFKIEFKKAEAQLVEGKQVLEHYLNDFKEGVVYISKHSYVKTFFLFCTAFFFLISPAAFITPLQVIRKFGEEVWVLSAIEVAFSVGMLLGGVLISTWGGFRNRVLTMIFSSIAVSVLTVGLGLADYLWVYIGIMALTGISVPLFSTPATVLLQERVDSAFLGRVFGVFGMISSSMMPFGMVLFGPLADKVEIDWILVSTGLLLLAMSLNALRNKSFISAGIKAESY